MEKEHRGIHIAAAEGHSHRAGADEPGDLVT